jgi:3',5'-cyclic-AMP phosphodiesterase
MKRIFAIYKILLSTLFLVFINGCENYFEYSPYAANVKDEYKKIGVKNLNNLLNSSDENNDEITFVVLADSHYDYHELDEALVNINAIDDIDFVIVNGDIADHGYLKEFELFHEKMKKLNVPYLTVIGNHDYRSNGLDIYKEMYGEPNKSFTFNNNQFILFDDVFWESNKTPDMDWLEDELLKVEEYNNTFMLCHIPPYGDQFTEEIESNYENLMETYDVDLSVHGHTHNYNYDENSDGETSYLTVGSIMKKEYVVIMVSGDNYTVEQVKY